MHRSPGIYFAVEENLRIPQLGYRLVRAVRLVSTSNGAPYFQMSSVGSHSTSGMNLATRTSSILAWFQRLSPSLGTYSLKINYKLNTINQTSKMKIANLDA